MDEALDARFPVRRICRAEIVTKDGKAYLSPECEPRGEACEHIDTSWLADKFRRITSPVFTAAGQDALLSMILQKEDIPVRTIVAESNKAAYWR